MGVPQRVRCGLSDSASCTARPKSAIFCIGEKGFRKGRGIERRKQETEKIERGKETERERGEREERKSKRRERE